VNKKHTSPKTMKTQKLFIAALLGFAMAACQKNQPAAETPGTPPPAEPQTSIETKLKAAYGFAAQLPADEEGYVAVYNLDKFWRQLKCSKTFATLRANPLVQQALHGPLVQLADGQLSKNPDARRWRAIASDALGNEVFLTFAPGSAQKFKMLMQLSDEMRVADIKISLAGNKTPNAAKNLAPVILPYLKTLDVPPFIIGFKLSAQKAALVAEIDRGEKNLPPGLELTAFNVNGTLPFKSIVATLGKALPPAQQEELKKLIAGTVPDPKQADDTLQALLARKVEVAYGFVGDYLVASIGSDHSHLKLAANFADSLLARPEVGVAANYAGKPMLCFSWSSAELLAALQKRAELLPYYAGLKDELTNTLSSADVQKLQTDLERLDGEAAKAFGKDFTPMVGVSYIEHGIRGERFGGLKPRAGTGLKFSNVPSASTFFWLDAASDPVVSAACRTWAEDFATTAYDTFQRIGLAKLPDQQRTQFSIFQTQAVPRIQEFYRITKEQFIKALGSENAVALDLNGALPANPFIPPPIHDAGRMPRLAYLSDVQDATLLGQSWDGYLKLARDIAKTVPQAAMLPGGLPDPGKETIDGVTLSYYKPPMDTGDLLPNIATTASTFVASTSRSYSLELSKAAAKPAADAGSTMFDLRMNFASAFDFAGKWMALAVQYPDLFFHGDKAKADEFVKSEPALADMLQSLRSFQGMDARVYEENGVRRASSAIHWHEQ
jgi:hypothetical protein